MADMWSLACVLLVVQKQFFLGIPLHALPSWGPSTPGPAITKRTITKKGGSTAMTAQHATMQWPTPSDGQSRITLLGSPHLANPGHDAHNVAVDDPLTSKRQQELAIICDHLENGDFDHVAVELPRDCQSGVDEQYEAIQGGAALHEEDAFPAGPAAIRGEAVQIGFRLAAALDHDQVKAVDSRPPFPDSSADWAIAEDPATVPYSLPDMEALVAAEEQRLRKSTLLALLQEKNRSEHLQTLHAANIAASFSSSSAPDGDEYTGSRQVGHWFERNGRMLENLNRVTGADEETLFIVGASHVIPVKQLADAFPATCPQSPRPFLGC